MDVTEREDKLQRHRCKRQPTPAPLFGPNPTHQANRAKTNAVSVYSRAAVAQWHRC
jgi:hypothetical protein